MNRAGPDRRSRPRIPGKTAPESTLNSEESKHLSPGCYDVLGIGQSKVSELLRGRLSGFSTERLLRFLTQLGRDVEIAIRPKPRNHATGEIRVLEKAAVGVS